MIATLSLDLYAAALRYDADVLMKRLGFDQRFGRKRLASLIDDAYLTEMKVIVQLVRWHEIGLVKPYEIDVPHPALLMIDLRRRIAVSPKDYVPSFIMEGTIQRMITWWSENTITSAWRSVKAHVRVAESPTEGMCDALAEFLWELRDTLTVATSGGVQKDEVEV
jgi:hypothetical protein